jgi:import inner membrane translocase subunit TIM13
MEQRSAIVLKATNKRAAEQCSTPHHSYLRVGCDRVSLEVYLRENLGEWPGLAETRPLPLAHHHYQLHYYCINHLQSIPTMSQQDLSNLSPEQAQQVMQQVRQQGAMQAQQEILVSSSKKCFEKCVTRPGATLSNKEQTCLAMCFDRYLETMQVVSQSMSDRSNQ